jgi:hypothetical protein
MFGVIGRRNYPYMGDRPWPRPKPGQAKPTFWLLAWLVILQSPSRPKPGLSGQARASTSLICIGNYDYLNLSWVGGRIVIGLWGCIFELRNARGGVLNFEIVSSIGSSARYRRISQQEETSYGFYFICFVTHSFARRSYCAGQTRIYSLTSYWARLILTLYASNWECLLQHYKRRGI